MTLTPIRAVPMWYRNTKFRSTLEADWAATFDALNMYWQYEPIAVQIGPGEAYLCDFFLPSQQVWCEVKGPHDERIEKVAKFHRILDGDPFDVREPMVIILRAAGPHEVAVWEGVTKAQNIILAHCPDCDDYSFMDTEGTWQCRRCFYGNHPMRHDNKFWMADHAPSGSMRFTRAPRPTPRAAA